jgi:hypothetical protein
LFAYYSIRGHKLIRSVNSTGPHYAAASRGRLEVFGYYLEKVPKLISQERSMEMLSRLLHGQEELLSWTHYWMRVPRSMEKVPKTAQLCK